MYTIVTVSHNHEKHILRLLESLNKYITVVLQVIIVDNTNNGLIFEKIKDDYNFEIVLVNNVKKYSFSRNNNIGVSCAKYENIILLNPDIWLENLTLNNFLRKNNLDSRTFYYPKLYNADGTNQVHCKKKPCIYDQFLTFVYSIVGAKRSSPEGNYWCMAAAIVFKKNLFLEIGGFDENFIMYMEDAELCDRIRKRNYNLCILGDVSLKHLLHDNSKNKYLHLIVISALYYRIKILYNTVIRYCDIFKKNC